MSSMTRNKNITMLKNTILFGLILFQNAGCCDAFQLLQTTRIHTIDGAFGKSQRVRSNSLSRNNRFGLHAEKEKGSLSARTSQTKEQFEWLKQTTTTLLDEELFPLGHLENGKWHELQSMMIAWLKLISSCSSSKVIPFNVEDSSEYPAVMIEKLLKRIIDEYSVGNDDVQISSRLYNIAIEGWAETASTRNAKLPLLAAQRATDIVHQMQSSFEDDPTCIVKPNHFSFFTALNAWTKACSALHSHGQTNACAEASEKAAIMLEWMEELAKSDRNEGARPSAMAYSLVMDSFVKSGNFVSPGELLRHMQRETVKPNTFCFNMVINGYTKSGLVKEAEVILKELEDEYMKGGDVSPDVFSYTMIINAWANSKRGTHGALMAEAILMRMESMAENTKNHDIRPNSVTYNSVLSAWCKSGSHEAAEKATCVFDHMEFQHLSGNPNAAPDRKSFNTLIHTLTKAGNAKSLILAEKILDRMEAYETQGVKNLAPNLFSYNTIIEGWGKVKGENVLNAWKVLEKLLLAQKHREDLEPDRYSFNNIIFALSKSGQKDAELRIENLLRYMEREFQSGRISVSPDIFAYSSAIHTWARSGKKSAGARAEEILNELEHRYNDGEEHLKPTTVTYNSVIDCLANSGQGIVGAVKAGQLLARMEEMYEADHTSIKPTCQTYNNVISAWARSGTRCAYRKSEAILFRMWKRYDSGISDVRPDSLTFHGVLNAISRSQRRDKGQAALRMLRTMDKMYRAGNKDARPNHYTYTSVLNSCAFTFESDLRLNQKALDTAIFTLEELQESTYGSPDHVTYGMFLKACHNLIPSDEKLRRRTVIEPVFLQCVQDGQVGEMVLKHLRTAAPKDLFQELVGSVTSQGMTVRLEDLPKEWRCNVREGRISQNRTYRMRPRRQRNRQMA